VCSVLPWVGITYEQFVLTSGPCLFLEIYQVTEGAKPLDYTVWTHNVRCKLVLDPLLAVFPRASYLMSLSIQLLLLLMLILDNRLNCKTS
jgi:hypothetical protein